MDSPITKHEMSKSEMFILDKSSLRHEVHSVPEGRDEGHVSVPVVQVASLLYLAIL